MDRRSLRYGYFLIAITGVLTLFAAGGCRNFSTFLGYMIKGNDLPPKFAGLKGKKVVVVCRPLASLEFKNAGADREIAKQVGALLQARVPKCTVVDQQKVAKWMDSHSWKEYAEVGKALKADMVVGIDLTSFSTMDGQTLWRGKADATIQVYDLSKDQGKRPIWDDSLPQCVYPPNCSIPQQDESASDFRKDFIAVLADQIGRYFYAHEPNADIGADSRALH
jgi:hypothetical protein